MKLQVRTACCLIVVAAGAMAPAGLRAVVDSAGENDKLPPFRLPPGFVIEQVAMPPLLEHPMMANFDEQGRLYIAESVGLNWKRDELLANPPNLIRVLEPADATGRFHTGRIFADKMTLPMGVLWHDGLLYSASPPSLWTLADSDLDGQADRRRELVTKFGFTGNAADIHGPFLGPDGWIYWCDGRHGHDIVQPDGTKMQGKAARIFRCRPDGSGIETVCGGGMDNPVEIAFSDEGEAFATVNILHNKPARNDGIIFCIEGGVYPWNEVFLEFAQTGDLLPAVEDLGWVAPSGLMRYRGTALGREYQGNLFSAQFNRNRIQRHILERDGAGFKVKTEDFLVADDRNFHPTDVLEDADGSLLVVDTGGWFRIGCPTSRIARPELKGALYRIRRQGTEKIDDPRGLRLAWKSLAPADLVTLLDDSRPAVRDRATHELAKHDAEALAPLADLLRSPKSSSLACRNAVWALTRIAHPEARKLVRGMITDRDFSVRMAAMHSVGMHRDDRGLSQLLAIIVDGKEQAALRRQAATALGRIGKAEAVAPLMEGVRLGADRFLEHSLIFALFRCGADEQVAKYLTDPSPEVRRAALITLDQTKSALLTRASLTPLLNTEQRALQQAALKVIISRPEWGAEVAGLFGEWLRQPRLDDASRDALRGIMLGMHKEATIRQLAAAALADSNTPLATRLLLLETMSLLSLAELPAEWLAQLRAALGSEDEATVTQAVATLRAIGADRFDGELLVLARQARRSASVRLSAFAAAAPRLQEVDAPLFAFLCEQLAPTREPLSRLAAASALAGSRLSVPQLLQLVPLVASAGPLELPHLLGPFEKSADAQVGRHLVAALEKSAGLTALPPGSLERVFRGYPADVQKGTVGLNQRLQAESAKQRLRLSELEPLLTGGDADRGRLVFFGAKAACGVCHTAEKRGGRIGPELSAIGAIRSGRDLLEAVVFPSSSFARGYEPYVVETRQGLVHQGILGRETTAALHLITADRTEIRVPRTDIDNLLPGRVSIMPQGLDTQLGRDELRDLLAYVQALR